MQWTAGQQQAHMDSQLPARSMDLPWSTSLVLPHRVRGFFCSSGGSFGTQDFPFLLYSIPAGKPSRASSHQELISCGTLRRAQVSLFHVLTALSRSKTSWQGGEVSESPRKGRRRKCSCQADPAWLLLDLGQMELARS